MHHNPNLTCPGVVWVDHWKIEALTAYKLRLESPEKVQGSARVLPCLPRDSSQPIQVPDDEVRHYPDEELWPGYSILEFL
jgi:hypothetical protein